LPGKKFPFYSTIDKYDFNNLDISVELRDDRFNLNLDFIKCSDIEISNMSEFNNLKGIYAVKDYIDTIFEKSNINVDSLSTHKLTISLEALDVRQIGFGRIKVHGLCQMKFKYKDFEQTYCIDIVDGDEHAPLGKNSFVTRKTASRYMLSASIREVIEQFLIDLKKIENSGYFDLQTSKGNTTSKGDTITYKTKNKLEWSDFKMNPDLSDSAKIQLNLTIATFTEKADVWFGTIKVESFAGIRRDLSWVKPEFKNDLLLEYVQLKYDIANIYAKRAENEINKKKINASSTQKIGKIIESHIREMNQILEKYDTETNCGDNKDMIDKWKIKMVNGEL
jgi:hypothetical protein